MQKLNDNDPIPYGKFKGTKMEKIPAKYLHYLWVNGLQEKRDTDPVAGYIAANIAALELEYRDGIWR
jgi:hypothetical protein